MKTFLKIIKVSSSIGTILAIYLLSEGMLAYGFTIGALANIAWLYWSHEMKDMEIFLINSVMVFVNLNGLGVL